MDATPVARDELLMTAHFVYVAPGDDQEIADFIITQSLDGNGYFSAS